MEEDEKKSYVLELKKNKKEAVKEDTEAVKSYFKASCQVILAIVPLKLISRGFYEITNGGDFIASIITMLSGAGILAIDLKCVTENIIKVIIALLKKMKAKNRIDEIEEIFKNNNIEIPDMSDDKNDEKERAR